MKLLGKIRKFSNVFIAKGGVFPGILTFIWLLIIKANYIPGTILSGWDTLHPEFNFSLNFSRLIFGVFREEQGLGAVAAHAHMSDLPRVILLWISSFILPDAFLRFFFISVCLLVGVLGVYFFMKKVILSHLNKTTAQAISFISALFYLFNLTTVQQFYVPFEMFTVQYAMLPWIFYSVVRYIEKPTKNKLALVGLVNLLAAPMAYASLLWYVYFGSLIMFLIPMMTRNFKRALMVLLVTLLVNAFWILPNLYFVASGNAALVPEAKINKLFSEEAYLQNASFGNITDYLIFKNFLFNWPVYVGFDRFDYLLSGWKAYLANPFILMLGYIAAGISLIGVGLSILRPSSLRHENKYLSGFVLILIVGTFFLLGSLAPLSYLTDFLRDNSSIFKEALRFPFTKFSIITTFVFAIFFGLGNLFLYSIIVRIKGMATKNWFSYLYAFLISVMLIIYCLPMFQGQLISRLMQVKIPGEYFQLFEYLNSTQGDGRVVVIPAHSLWGWIYYDWGFQGAQFITFGINKPVLDRDWDRWNPKNEEFYRQLSYAIYSGNEQYFENVLQKYRVEYLVIDPHIIAAGSEKDGRQLNINEIRLMMSRINKMSLVKKIGNFEIYRYETEDATFKIAENPTTVKKQSLSEDVDQIFLSSKNYINDLGETQNLVSNNLNFLPKETISETEQFYNLSLNNNQSKFSEVLDKEMLLPVNVYAKKVEGGVAISLVPVYGNINVEDGKKFVFSTNKLGENYLLNFDNYQTLKIKELSTEFKLQGIANINTRQFNNIALYINDTGSFETIPDQSIEKSIMNTTKDDTSFELSLCNKAGENQVFASGNIENGKLSIAAQNSRACVWIPLDKILTQESITSYKTLIGFHFSINAGSDAMGRFCLYDNSRQRCVLEQKYLLKNDEQTVYFLVDRNMTDRFNLVLYLDGTEKDKLQQIEYQNISTEIKQPVEVVSLGNDELLQYFDGVGSFMDQSIFAISKSGDANFKLNLFEPGHTDNDCDTLQASQSRRTVNGDTIEYYSRQGSSCDYYSLPNVSHASGYLLEIESKNEKGMPLRVCIANPYSKRCDIYTSLKVNKDFDKDYLLIPPLFDGGVGYDIHFDNYAVGSFETKNAIKSLRLVPVPYNYLRTLNGENTIKTDDNSIFINNYNMTKIFPGIITVTLPQINGDAVLIFDRAYDKGWWSNVGDHVLVNSWQNGWKISAENSNTKVWVFFWPELLESVCLLGLSIWGIKFLWNHKSKLNGKIIK